MSRFSIPNPKNRLWQGIFAGEDFGNIWAGRSIELERNKGKIGLADSYSDLFDSSEAGFGNLTTPVAFVRSSADSTDRWWANAGKLFKATGTNPEAGWAEDAIANSPASPLYDLIDFAGALICPTSDNLSRLSAGVWTASWWQGTLAQAALTVNPHRFAILGGSLLITDGMLIQIYDGTIVKTTQTLPQGFKAEFILIFGELAFVGGAQIGGGESYVYTVLEGSNADTYLARYPIGDTEALGGFISDSVYIVTKKGLIKRFNGSGFETVQQFPTVEAQQSITSIHPNGISVTENIAKMLVNFGVITNTRLVSGFWNYDIKNKNLYHAGSVRNTSTKDYSQGELAGVGALKQTVVSQGLYLAGAQVYTVYSGTSRYGIFSSDEENTNNQGYFITPKIHSSDVSRFWRLIFATMKNMTSADDRFRIAIKTSDSNKLPAYETITWLTSSTFTAANTDIAAGDFVEIIAGDNGGAIARITGISGTTVTIDRSLYASTNTARVRYHRFTDLGTISNVQVQTEIFHSTVRSPFIQCLIEFRGTEQSPLLESLIFDYKDLKQVV